ncbi:hypothetical protein [Iningainema tapete]|uniref:Uncharacterized protein n=1 Tax=Iningainema tapete BLCC-T55 TaxID=2748662 RepID=A0A8J6XG87_9CYAN|nr:hypothetical protein [Iningainema tapete]MBD2771124.1 hypothetical protein [Iningainema tapete BLCC-T55]
MVDKDRQPLAYYVFWGVFIAICLGLIWCAWQNVLPYQAVVRKIFRLSNRPTQIIPILWFRVQLSLAWLVGAIFWAILQGFQISHLLITQSEKALDFLIKKANSKGVYQIRSDDASELRFAKKRYNALPLATLTYLKLACIVAYVIEFFVNIDTYPLVDGGWWGAVLAIALFQWDRIRMDNLAMVLLTLFAVEGLVFAAIMCYRIIEVFRDSEAYKLKSKQSGNS